MNSARNLRSWRSALSTTYLPTTLTMSLGITCFCFARYSQSCMCTKMWFNNALVTYEQICRVYLIVSLSSIPVLFYFLIAFLSSSQLSVSLDFKSLKKYIDGKFLYHSTLPSSVFTQMRFYISSSLIIFLSLKYSKRVILASIGIGTSRVSISISGSIGTKTLVHWKGRSKLSRPRIVPVFFAMSVP